MEAAIATSNAIAAAIRRTTAASCPNIGMEAAPAAAAASAAAATNPAAAPAVD